jgi:quercetin dioxygenase-like cupin family protein
MAYCTVDKPTAYLLDAQALDMFDVMGPKVEFLTVPDGRDDSACLMRGTIPAGVFIPLHSHADPETFIPVSGEAEALIQSPDGLKWLRLGPGKVLHVPGGARHAFCNRTEAPATMIVVSTSRIGRFFIEVGEQVRPGSPAPPPSKGTLGHFLSTAERYGYWNATPEENARAGIPVPG